MARHIFSVHYVDVLLMLGIALMFLWRRLIGVSVRALFANATLTVTGYLRPRPIRRSRRRCVPRSPISTGTWRGFLATVPPRRT